MPYICSMKYEIKKARSQKGNIFWAIYQRKEINFRAW